MATANSMAERSARCSSTAPPTAGATSLDIIHNVTGAAWCRFDQVAPGEHLVVERVFDTNGRSCCHSTV
jgi:hypothetical protein